MKRQLARRHPEPSRPGRRDDILSRRRREQGLTPPKRRLLSGCYSVLETKANEDKDIATKCGNVYEELSLQIRSNDSPLDDFGAAEVFKSFQKELDIPEYLLQELPSLEQQLPIYLNPAQFFRVSSRVAYNVPCWYKLQEEKERWCLTHKDGKPTGETVAELLKSLVEKYPSKLTQFNQPKQSALFTVMRKHLRNNPNWGAGLCFLNPDNEIIFGKQDVELIYRVKEESDDIFPINLSYSQSKVITLYKSCLALVTNMFFKNPSENFSNKLLEHFSYTLSYGVIIEVGSGIREPIERKVYIEQSPFSLPRSSEWEGFKYSFGYDYFEPTSTDDQYVIQVVKREQLSRLAFIFTTMILNSMATIRAPSPDSRGYDELDVFPEVNYAASSLARFEDSFKFKLQHLRLLCREQQILRDPPLDTLGVNLFSRNPQLWEEFRSLTDGKTPENEKTFTRCIWKVITRLHQLLTKWKRGNKDNQSLYGRTTDSCFLAQLKRIRNKYPFNLNDKSFRGFLNLLKYVIGRGGYSSSGFPFPILIGTHFIDLQELKNQDVYRYHPIRFINTEFCTEPVFEVEEEFIKIDLLFTSSHVSMLTPLKKTKSDLGDSIIKENYLLGDGGMLCQKGESLVPEKTRLPKEDKCPNKIIVFDYETLNSELGLHGDVVEYALGAAIVKDPFSFHPSGIPAITNTEPFSFIGHNCTREFFIWLWENPLIPLQQKKYSETYLVAHNGSKFDFYFIYRAILEQPYLHYVLPLPEGRTIQEGVPSLTIRIVPNTIIKKGSRLMTFKFEIRLGKHSKIFTMRDTILYWSSSLLKLGEFLDCEVSKGEFSYEKIVSIEQFMLNTREAALFRKKLLVYLDKDVLLLAEICIKLPDLFLRLFNLDMWQGITTASLAKKNYFQNYYKPSLTKDLLFSPSLLFDSDYRQSFFGGRNEAFALGTFIADTETKLWYVDATSLYPSVMYHNDFPLGLPNVINLDNCPIEETIKILFREKCLASPTHIAAIKCSFKQTRLSDNYPPLLGSRNTVVGGEKRLVFGFGRWEGWLTQQEFDFLMNSNYIEIEDFACQTLHVFERGTPFKKNIGDVFLLKEAIDKELEEPNLSSKRRTMLNSKRTVVKLMLNSSYGFWALKLLDGKNFQVNDTTSPAQRAVIETISSICWATDFPKQTVFETGGVITLRKRNVLYGLWTTALSRLELYKVIVQCNSKPWRKVLYVDTDSLHVLDRPPSGEKDFWEDVIMTDPIKRDHVNLGGWTNELLDKKTMIPSIITRLDILGLKLYSYRYEKPDGTEGQSMKIRGWNQRMNFDSREIITLPSGKLELQFMYNWSEALFKEMKEENIDYKGPFSIKIEDIEALSEEKISSILGTFFSFRAGNEVLVKEKKGLTRILTQRTIQKLYDKGHVCSVRTVENNCSYYEIKAYN